MAAVLSLRAIGGTQLERGQHFEPRRPMTMEHDFLHDRWLAGGFWQGISLAGAFAKAAATRPAALLEVHSVLRSARVTLREVHHEGRALAGALAALGLKQGDVVALQLPNWIETAFLWQAAAALGCVVLPIVSIFGEAELEFILRDSRARALFVPKQWGRNDPVERVRRLGALHDLKAVVVVGGDGDSDFVGWTRFAERAAPISPPDVAPGDPAFMVYTSGTTANPKGVLHSSQTLLCEVRQMHVADRTDGPVLSPYPSGHIAGALGILNHAVAARDTHLFDAWNADEAARVIDQEGVTVMSGTPFHYLGLLDAAEAGGYSLGSLRSCGTGGATVPETLVRRADAAGLALYRRYGMSEHPTVTQGDPADPLDVRMSTDGRPLPGVEIRIVGDDGEDVMAGAEGEIATRGPDMFLGYNDPDATAAAMLAGGWFLSGDIGRIDCDGYLAITDRKKDIIIRGGENISSREVEEVVLSIPGVVEAAAIGAPDERLGERICVFVSVEEGVTLDMVTIDQAFRSAGMARQKTPERLIISSSFPRTAAGKIRKADLRRQLKDESAK